MLDKDYINMAKLVAGAYATQSGLPDGSSQLAVLHHYNPNDNRCDEVYGYWLCDSDLYPVLLGMPRAGRTWRVESRGKMEFAVWTEPARRGEIGCRHYLHEEIWRLAGNPAPLPTHTVGFVNLDFMDVRASNLCVKWLPRQVRIERGLLDPESVPETGLRMPRWKREDRLGTIPVSRSGYSNADQTTR